MKNIFLKISSIAKNISNTAKEKIDNVGSSVRNKVGAILTGSFLAVSTPAIAENNWVQVDTPGIGPREFSVKYFNNPNWELLKDKEGKIVENPNTDFKLGREYTIGRREDIVKKDTKKTPPVTRVDEKKVNPFVSKETYTLSYNDLQSKLDITAYKEAVASFESNGKYTARNDKKGKENGVEIDKWAFGKYQFTVGTLKGYGVHLTKNGVLDEKKVKYFLGNKELQEDLMNKYIAESLNMISGNSQIHKPIIDGVVSIPALLAKGHIAGQGSIDKKWGGKDWLGTPVRVYAKKIEKTYHTMLAANDSSITEKAQVSEALPNALEKVTFASVVIEERKVIPLVLAETPQVEKIAKVQVQSANDSYYSEKVTDLKGVSSPGIQTVVTKVEVRVNEVVAGIQDTMMRQSIEKKLSSPYETKMEGLYANFNHYDNLAIQYEKEARSAIRVKRESLLADAKDARNTANKIKLVISHFEEVNLLKAA